MEAFYFKYKTQYINGSEAKNYNYCKLAFDGTITSLSMGKKSMSLPNTMNIPKGYEVTTREEFEEAKKQLGF